jgi:predicted PurR-regulated permease PerM
MTLEQTLKAINPVTYLSYPLKGLLGIGPTLPKSIDFSMGEKALNNIVEPIRKTKEGIDAVIQTTTKVTDTITDSVQKVNTILGGAGNTISSVNLVVGGIAIIVFVGMFALAWKYKRYVL